ncbi:MAG: hypothetical protein ACI395_06145, partial [Candidatus Cryptobacteroides sp.]
IKRGGNYSLGDKIVTFTTIAAEVTVDLDVASIPAATGSYVTGDPYTFTKDEISVEFRGAGYPSGGFCFLNGTNNYIMISVPLGKNISSLKISCPSDNTSDRVISLKEASDSETAFQTENYSAGTESVTYTLTKQLNTVYLFASGKFRMKTITVTYK